VDEYRRPYIAYATLRAAIRRYATIRAAIRQYAVIRADIRQYAAIRQYTAIRVEALLERSARFVLSRCETLALRDGRRNTARQTIREGHRQYKLSS
jgi:hypothetical protein